MASTQRGTTLFEMVAVLVIVAIVAAIAIPGAAAVRRVIAADAAATRLALVLRGAQAHAQVHEVEVAVVVAAEGSYSVSATSSGGEPQTIARGDFGVPVSSNYPGGAVEFGPRGWPALPGSASPRAGRFSVAAGAGARIVVVQLAGCVRCL